MCKRMFFNSHVNFKCNLWGREECILFLTIEHSDLYTGSYKELNLKYITVEVSKKIIRGNGQKVAEKFKYRCVEPSWSIRENAVEKVYSVYFSHTATNFLCYRCNLI